MGRTKRSKTGLRSHREVTLHHNAVLQLDSFRSRVLQNNLHSSASHVQLSKQSEALMTDPEWPHYFDVFHPVVPVRHDSDYDSWACRCAAFPDDNRLFDVPISLFVPPSLRQRDVAHLNVGDLINFRLRHRSLDDGSSLDGLLSESGVWVRGLILHLTDDSFFIAHYNWSKDLLEHQRLICPSFIKFPKISPDLRSDPLGPSVPLSFTVPPFDPSSFHFDDDDLCPLDAQNEQEDEQHDQEDEQDDEQHQQSSESYQDPEEPNVEDPDFFEPEGSEGPDDDEDYRLNSTKSKGRKRSRSSSRPRPRPVAQSQSAQSPPDVYLPVAFTVDVKEFNLSDHRSPFSQGLLVPVVFCSKGKKLLCGVFPKNMELTFASFQSFYSFPLNRQFLHTSLSSFGSASRSLQRYNGPLHSCIYSPDVPGHGLSFRQVLLHNSFSPHEVSLAFSLVPKHNRSPSPPSPQQEDSPPSQDSDPISTIKRVARDHAHDHASQFLQSGHSKLRPAVNSLLAQSLQQELLQELVQQDVMQ